MARVQKVLPGRLVLSIIYSSIDALADSLDLLERQFSRVQFETVDIPYSNEEKYTEMVARDNLPQIKDICSRIEANFADRVDDFIFRTVNIDPGILTPDNLVIASHREYNHRVYLSNGVFAEMALIFARGEFRRLPWTSPNYYHDEAIEFFLRVRNSFEFLNEPDRVPAE